MRARQDHYRGTLGSLWRACVATLVIGFLLYNPFISLVQQPDGLSYHTMERHRATVGSSELQHFTPVQVHQAEFQADVTHNDTVPSTQRPAELGGLIAVEVFPPQLELAESTWTRPPPSL